MSRMRYERARIGDHANEGGKQPAIVTVRPSFLRIQMSEKNHQKTRELPGLYRGQPASSANFLENISRSSLRACLHRAVRHTMVGSADSRAGESTRAVQGRASRKFEKVWSWRPTLRPSRFAYRLNAAPSLVRRAWSRRNVGYTRVVRFDARICS